MAFKLPPEISELIGARNKLQARYRSMNLKFALDGNLLGDLGEALACRLFHLTLADANQAGFDGIAPDGRTVQVKSSGGNRGFAFRQTDVVADHLICLVFDYDLMLGQVVYNGPEQSVRTKLPQTFSGQRMVSMKAIAELDRGVDKNDRLREYHSSTLLIEAPNGHTLKPWEADGSYELLNLVN